MRRRRTADHTMTIELTTTKKETTETRTRLSLALARSLYALQSTRKTKQREKFESCTIETKRSNAYEKTRQRARARADRYVQVEN